MVNGSLPLALDNAQEAKSSSKDDRTYYQDRTALARCAAQPLLEIIRAQVSLLEVVRYYVPLKQRGSRYIGLCPFHAEKTPSFGVHNTKRFYKCFGCDAH